MKRTLLTKLMLLLCALVAGSGSVWATDVTYTISGKNTLTTTGTAPSGSSATIAETYTTSKQMTSGNSQTLTLKGYNGYKITALTLSMHSNSKGGAGKLSYSINGDNKYTNLISDNKFSDPSWHGSWSTSYVNVTKSNLSLICGEKNVIIIIEATESSLYCQSYTITYEAVNYNPSITASDVNIAYNATSGSIGYSMTNANGNVTASVTNGDWLSLGDIDEDEVPFTCSANPTNTARTATVTLSYTDATDKVVTVTQAAAPTGTTVITLTAAQTLTFTDFSGLGSYANNRTDYLVGSDGESYKWTGSQYCSSSNELQLRAKGNSNGTGTITSSIITSPNGFSLSLTYICGTEGTNYPTLKAGNEAIAATSRTTNKDNTPNTIVFDITSTSTPITIEAGANATYISEIKMVGKKSATTLSFTENAQSIAVGMTATYTATGSRSGIVYSTSDASIATVNESTGEVTGVAEGTVTITATLAETEEYEGATTSYSLTVDAGSVDVKLAASGYASYCSPYPLDLTPGDGYAAYAVTATSDATVTFTKIPGAVPAETPFILYGEGKGGTTINLPVATGVTTAVTGNMLVGTLAPTAITTVSGDYTNFGLSGGKFVKINDGTLPANKAYLPVLTANLPSSSAPEFTIIFKDMQTTGVNDVRSKMADVRGDFFDLQGRKVANPTKGMYIVNGKKVIVK